MSLQYDRELRDGRMIPVLGLGTWNLGGSECKYAVKRALELGYRHIDTAEMYGNHREIGEAMTGFDRSKIFLTSKVWSNHLHYDDLQKACDRTLRELSISYLDLYLIHWPNPRVPLKETFKALEELVASGRVRSVGVSNFDVSLLRESLEVSGTPVTVDQVKFHPYSYDKELIEFCNSNRIVVTAYSPLERGSLVRERTVMDVASKYRKTPAQICLRWCLQKGTVVIPKARSEDHLRENMEIFDWKISEEDMSRMDPLSGH
jgi:diketogulonate reductase-like aldo/keto reductase